MTKRNKNKGFDFETSKWDTSCVFNKIKTGYEKNKKNKLKTET